MRRVGGEIEKAIRLYGRDEFTKTLAVAARLGWRPERLAVLSIAADEPSPIWHFAALRRIAHAEFAAHPFILDCGEQGGSVLEAWENGIEAAVFSGGKKATAALRQRGATVGKLLFAPNELPPIFDVGERRSGEFEEWLREK